MSISISIHDVFLKPLQLIKSEAHSLKKCNCYKFEELKELATKVVTLSELLLENEHLINDGMKMRLEIIINDIYAELYHLSIPFDKVASKLLGVYNQLIEIKSKLWRYLETSSFKSHDIEVLQDELHELENKYVHDGKFIVPKEEAADEEDQVPPGQAILIQTLNQCYKYVNQCLYTLESLDESLMPLYYKLVDIHNELEQADLTLDRKREIQIELYRISASRVNGLYFGKPPSDNPNEITGSAASLNNPVPQGQGLLVSILEKNYEQMYELNSKSEKYKGNSDQTLEKVIKIGLALRNIVLGGRQANIDIINEVGPLLGELNVIEQQLIEEADNEENKKNRGTKMSKQIHLIINHCYQKIYSILYHSECVDPSIESLHQDLLHIRRCLLELRNVFCNIDYETEFNDTLPKSSSSITADFQLSYDDLLPYKVKLLDISSKCVDGKFYNSQGQVPYGQSVLSCLMHQSYEILNELMSLVVDDYQVTNEIREALAFPVLSFNK